MKFKTDIDFASGGSNQGSLNASFDEIVEVFGEPTGNGDGEKVTTEWHIKFEDGVRACIYDYWTYELPNTDEVRKDNVQWSIGGLDNKAFEHVMNTLIMGSLKHG